MEKLIEALQILMNRDDSIKEFDIQLERNVTKALELLSINNNETLFELIPNLEKHQDHSIRWKYIYLLFHILLSIKVDTSIISIDYVANVKKSFQFSVALGILPNLIPGVGIDLNKRSKHLDNLPKDAVDLSIKQQYYRLTGTTKLLLLCIDSSQELRSLVLTNHLSDLLASLLQLCYAIIKKPSEGVDTVMTPQFYNEIMTDRELFAKHLDKFLAKPYDVTQELMFLYGNRKSPKWLKMAVFRILNARLLNDDGVELLIKAIGDNESFDIDAKWQQYGIIVKLVMTKSTQIPERIYYTNICTQIINLLSKTDKKQSYDFIVAVCIQYLYETNKNLCLEYFIQPILSIFANYSKTTNKTIEETRTITHEVLIVLYLCVVETNGSPTSIIPSSVLTPIINILFHIYISTRNTYATEISEKLIRILIKFINDSKTKNQIFESFLFDTRVEGVLELKENIAFVVQNHKIAIECFYGRSPLIRTDSFLDLIQHDRENMIIIPLFLYLLEISINDSLDLFAERKLVAYKLLSTLVANEQIQTHLKRDPKVILNYVTTALTSITTTTNDRKCWNIDSEKSQMIFLLIMIVNILNEHIEERLLTLLNKIREETTNFELKKLITNTCAVARESNESKSINEYEKAIEEVCDDLVPVRGHGLATLAKLIENNDPDACENKQYILNLCQQQLKNDDSYIYLNAICALSALGTTFPDTVLSILTEEYASDATDFERDNKTRMKLGEVLLRIVRNLGDAAPKYKSLLLNSFLSGVRDEDNLMRASSLSNLGEFCRVLGYKLGSVISEILTCIHAVILTDAALEARRAAVSAIRSLFIGLHADMILFLKDDILPIYRTLKDVYTSDPDHVTRLQAQLALQQLNENVKDFVLPKLQLSTNSSILK